MTKVLLTLFITVQLFAAEMLERTQVLMGTYVTIALPKNESSALQQSFRLIKEVEASLSSYDPQADIYRLNHERNVTITPYTYEALLLSQRYYKESAGYFDITVGSITKGLYRFGERERVAKEGELARAKVDFKGLHFDADRAWLDAGTMIDLGGMGKGFAVDKAAAFLNEQNITQGKVALSGDIRCLGICEMAVQNPFGDGVLATFRTKLPGTAVSTSGNYRRYVGQKTENHLIDPKQKRPEQLFASVTLISHGSNSDIDAYATAASVMTLEKALAFLKRQGVGYILLTNGGERYLSENMPDFTQELHFTSR